MSTSIKILNQKSEVFNQLNDQNSRHVGTQNNSEDIKDKNQLIKENQEQVQIDELKDKMKQLQIQLKCLNSLKRQNYLSSRLSIESQANSRINALEISKRSNSKMSNHQNHQNQTLQSFKNDKINGLVSELQSQKQLKMKKSHLIKIKSIRSQQNSILYEQQDGFNSQRAKRSSNKVQNKRKIHFQIQNQVNYNYQKQISAIISSDYKNPQISKKSAIQNPILNPIDSGKEPYNQAKHQNSYNSIETPQINYQNKVKRQNHSIKTKEWNVSQLKQPINTVQSNIFNVTIAEIMTQQHEKYELIKEIKKLKDTVKLFERKKIINDQLKKLKQTQQIQAKKAIVTLQNNLQHKNARSQEEGAGKIFSRSRITQTIMQTPQNRYNIFDVNKNQPQFLQHSIQLKRNKNPLTWNPEVPLNKKKSLNSRMHKSGRFYSTINIDRSKIYTDNEKKQNNPSFKIMKKKHNIQQFKSDKKKVQISLSEKSQQARGNRDKFEKKIFLNVKKVSKESEITFKEYIQNRESPKQQILPEKELPSKISSDKQLQKNVSQKSLTKITLSKTELKEIKQTKQIKEIKEIKQAELGSPLVQKQSNDQQIHKTKTKRNPTFCLSQTKIDFMKCNQTIPQNIIPNFREYIQEKLLKITLPPQPTPYQSQSDLQSLGYLLFSLFDIYIEDYLEMHKQDKLNYKVIKYKNCILFRLSQQHSIVWYFDGKFYFGRWQISLIGQGKKQGFGFEIVPLSYVYQGFFSNNKRQGYGIMANHFRSDTQRNIVFEGFWKEGLKHGNGYQIEEGLHYLGQFVQGLQVGQCKIKTQNTYYQGRIKQSVKQGKGYQILKNGDQYHGNFEKNTFQGKGQYKWKSGAYYYGDFQNGLRKGKGVWISNMRSQVFDCYKGEYNQNKKNGYGIYKWSNGTVYQGYFKDDLRHDEGLMKYPNGKAAKFIWKDGDKAYKLYSEQQQKYRKRNGLQNNSGKKSMQNEENSQQLEQNSDISGKEKANDHEELLEELKIKNQSLTLLDESFIQAWLQK